MPWRFGYSALVLLAFATNAFPQMEDQLPPGAFARLGSLRWQSPFRDGHGSATVCFSPDGRLLAVASNAGVAVLDAGTGRAVPWFAPVAAAQGIAFSADGK